MTAKVIYFSVGGREEQAEFSSEDSREDVREIFQAAAEAGPNDILKLYNTSGNLINISPKLKENTPQTRYRVEVVAAQCSGLHNVADIGFDVEALEKRIEQLEKTVTVDGAQLPDAVLDMKDKVEDFRLKLESVEHLSWLGLFKNMSVSSSLQTFSKWNKNGQFDDKTEDYHRRVYQHFIKMTNVQVTDEVRQYLRQPTFDNWQWDDTEMLILLRQMFIDLNLISKFSIEMPVLHEWLFEVYMHYNHVPFHNFKHCFMVAQMMYGLICLIKLEDFLESTEVLTLIVSAICHDLDHPGYNNAYQINAKTELAMRYNDISPLENHHCAVAFRILAKPQCNILRNVPVEMFRTIREGMIKCILATDMAKHSEILNNFKSCIHEFDFNNKDHKLLMKLVVMKVSDISNEARPMEVAEPWIDCLLTEFFKQCMVILIKMADISNEVRPMEVAEPWVECLLEEFFNQSDVEKLEGLPVAPFMDREKVSKPSSQIGFIKFVLLPLFETLGQLFPVIENDIIRPVRDALSYYTKMQQSLEEEQQKLEAKSMSRKSSQHSQHSLKLSDS